MAIRNSKEVEPERHQVLKVLGVFWAFLAVILAGVGVYIITQITFPHDAIERSITPAQFQCLSAIMGVFQFLALSAYCLMYKNSHSKWYSKLGKVVFCILFFMLYASVANEWTALALFAIMAFFALKKDRQKSSETAADSQHEEDSTSTH